MNQKMYDRRFAGGGKMFFSRIFNYPVKIPLFTDLFNPLNR